MSGLLRRKRKGAGPTVEQEAGTPTPTEGPGTGAGAPLPAGTDLDQLVGDRPTTQRRGRLRRRLRQLRGVRELLLRDLGGLVFEVHRSGQADSETHGRLVAEKLGRMAVVDAELHDLEARLDDRRGLVVREPGISGTCPSCGELHGSDARFCWACGTPVAPGARRPPEARPADLRALAAAADGPAPPRGWVEGHGEELPAFAPPPPPPPAAPEAPPPAHDGPGALQPARRSRPRPGPRRSSARAAARPCAPIRTGA